MSVIAASRSVRSRGIPPASSFRRFIHENGLSLILVFLFIVCWALQIFFGLKTYNEDQRDHHQPEIRIGEYLRSGHFIEATAENWESEFLQMAAYVVLTAMLVQRGSAESRDPDGKDDEAPLGPDSPWAARQGGWLRALYERSLGIALILLFLMSFVFHFWGSLRAANAEALLHGRPVQDAATYLLDSKFWFESFQNWQSEFLSTAVIVVLSIFLRQKGSPESKSVNAPHAATGA